MIVASHGEAECAAVLDLVLVHDRVDSVRCVVDDAVNLLHGDGGRSSGDLLHLLSIRTNTAFTVRLSAIHGRYSNEIRFTIYSAENDAEEKQDSFRTMIERRLRHVLVSRC